MNKGFTVFTACGLALFSAGLRAAEQAAPEKVVPGAAVVDANPLNVIVGLAFVLLTIFLLAWLLRRLNGFSPGSHRQMKVIAAMAVGTRERVVLIEVGGEQLLVGVAPGRVSMLQRFDEPVIVPGAPGNSEFSDKIKQLLKQGAEHP